MPELYERLVKTFMDVIVLARLEEREVISAYGMISFIRKKVHVRVPPSSMYALLYSMERRRLIEGLVLGRKRVYRLTEKGKEMLENISESSEDIVLLLKSILEK